jgi:hypothetical protein
MMSSSSTIDNLFSIPVVHFLAEPESIRLKSNLTDGFEKLESRRQLTTAFPNPPVTGDLHMIVQPRSGGQCAELL